MSKTCFVLMLLGPLVVLTGCGHGLPVAPASGVVLLDGSPLGNVSVMTQPVATNSPNPGPGSFGHTDAEGRFDLELVKPAVRGAIIGEHRVMIMQMGTTKSTPPIDKWPASFSDGSLRIQVPKGGTKELRVELSNRAGKNK